MWICEGKYMLISAGLVCQIDKINLVDYSVCSGYILGGPEANTVKYSKLFSK